MRRFLTLGVFLATFVRDAPGSWDCSQWISVKDAPVCRTPDDQCVRAADGTSCFAFLLQNEDAVQSARWTTAGLGVFEVSVNGVNVGTDFLKPGFTHNGKTKYSFAYDITELMRRGKGESNVFLAEVSSGWWRDKIVNFRGKKSAFRSVIELTFADGRKKTFGTNAKDWGAKVGGPVTHAGIYDGEEFDARLDIVPEDCQGWPRPEINTEFGGAILPNPGAGIVLRRDLGMRRGPYRLAKGGSLVIDFGQNCASVPEFRFRATKGTVLTACPGEMLNDAAEGLRGCDGPAGSVYRANLRMPDKGMRIVYTFAGDGLEKYCPRFTYFGYRYLSLRATDDVEIESVTSIPVTSVTRESETGKISTGDKGLNRLIANVRWGQLSNYLGIPTDCPQRDERLGWLADTQVFCEAGAFMADVQEFFVKWMQDVCDSQEPTGGFPGVAPPGPFETASMRFGWSDAGVIVPYVMWKYYGDASLARRHWASLELFMDRVLQTRYEFESSKAENHGFQWADWLSMEDFESRSGRAYMKGDDGTRVLRSETRLYWDYLGACYCLWDAQMMSELAVAVGQNSRRYTSAAGATRSYLKDRFLDRDGRLVKALSQLQTAFLFALKFGLVEGQAKTEAVEFLRKDLSESRLKTGFLGTSVLMDTLTENGMSDIAYSLLLSHDFPGWLYSVDQGATTIWERWNSYTKEKGFGPVDMNSFNHYAYGSVVAWIFKSIAGIAADSKAPGFRNVVMAPKPDRRLGFVTAEYNSAAGLIKSAWRYEGATWIWNFTVPDGATADVTAPGECQCRRYGPGRHEIIQRCLQ